MNIYLLTRPHKSNWDEYESCVVVAKTEEEARQTHPNGTFYEHVGEPCENNKWLKISWSNTWIHINAVKVELIGKANRHHLTRQVICSDFNAG